MDSPQVEAPPAAPAAARGDRVVEWLRENGADLANVVCLGVVAALVYTLDLDSIGIGGDAIRKWHFVRQWFYGNDFSHAEWDHHMARMGMNVVAYVVQLLFGRGPLLYYVPALFAGVVSVVMTYAAGKRLGGRFVGATAALSLIVFKPAHTASTQFLPEVFSAMYAIVAAYFFLRYVDAEGKRRLSWLIATSVALFAGYLGKETTVFFIPGFVIGILSTCKERRIRDVAVLLGVFAAGVALETAAYTIFTDYAHRFAVVKTEHVYDAKLDRVEFRDLFTRIEKATPEWKLVFYSYLPAALVVLTFVKKRTVTAIVVTSGIYYFLLSFLVRGIDPIVIWSSFQSRYLDCASPFVFLTLALFLQLIIAEFAQRIPSERPKKLERLRPLRHGVVPVLSGLIGILTYRAIAPRLDQHPFRVLPKVAAVLNDAYRRNLPLISVRNANGLWMAYSVLLDDKLLAKDGQLPSYDEVKRVVGGDQPFLVRDGSAYKGDKLRRLQKRHCAVEVMGKAGYTYVTPAEPLRPECDEELAR